MTLDSQLLIQLWNLSRDALSQSETIEGYLKLESAEKKGNITIKETMKESKTMKFEIYSNHAAKYVCSKPKDGVLPDLSKKAVQKMCADLYKTVKNANCQNDFKPRVNQVDSQIIDKNDIKHEKLKN